VVGKHTILFLAANPSGTDSLALEQEARAIQVELERSRYRDSFEVVQRFGAEPMDLLRELRKLKPTVVQFSGHGGQHLDGTSSFGPPPTRDVAAGLSPPDGELCGGLFFQDASGRPIIVSTSALRETFSAAGSSVRLVFLNACYSEAAAEALLAHVDCVVGMAGTIRDDAARRFAIGFYGGLGECESVGAAFRGGCAAIGLHGLTDGDRPRLRTRPCVAADNLIIATDAPIVRSKFRSWWGWIALVVVTGVVTLVVYNHARPLHPATEALPETRGSNRSETLESPPSDDLRLVDVAFAESGEFPILDLKVRNVGHNVAYLKRLELVVRKVWKLQSNVHPSSVAASWTYDVMLPLAPSDRPISVSASQMIAPNGVDRFKIRLGNDGASASVVYVFHISLALVYNEDERRLVSRPILFTAKAPFNQESWSFSPVSLDLQRRNLTIVRDIHAVDGLFSDELLALLDSLEVHSEP
jgi:hypothetical protein